MPTRPPSVVVVGLGPADEGLLTSAAIDALASAPACFARTRRHPAAGALPASVVTFDDLYDAGDDLEHVYAAIVEALVDAATHHGRVVYAVPGSPLVAERTVVLLLADDRVTTELVPALSFLDLAWVRLRVDPVACGARIVDGRRFAVEAAGDVGPFLVAQCDDRFVLSEVKLAIDEATDGRMAEPLVLLQRLGLPDEVVRPLPLAELDRDVEADHLTSVWVPRLASPIAGEAQRFAELVATLRAECPWDRIQTHRSLVPHLLEEAYEVTEALLALPEPSPAAGDGATDEVADAFAHLAEELGDLLFQVVFHATIATESGWFTLAEVTAGIADKLTARHPHVFGDDRADSAAAVAGNWERAKRAEAGHASAMDGIPTALPALAWASKAMRKAASAGVAFSDVDEALGKVREELAEVTAELGADDVGRAEAERELGDLLFAVAGVAFTAELDAESALRGAAGRFRDRVVAMESLAAAQGLDLRRAARGELDALWADAKRAT